MPFAAATTEMGPRIGVGTLLPVDVVLVLVV